MTEFADRVHRVKPSLTLEMTSRAADLRAQGFEIGRASWRERV